MESSQRESLVKQEQPSEDEDGSQVIICENREVIDMMDDVKNDKHTEKEISDVAAVAAKKRKRKFITLTDFVDKADDATKLKLSEIIKWEDLNMETLYRVYKVHEKLIKEEGNPSKERLAYYAELHDINENLVNVWVTNIIKDQLSQHKLDEKDVYLKKLPKRKSKSTGFYYNDCAIVVDNADYEYE